MRILFASDAIRPPWTGVGRAARTLLQGLRDAGAEVIAADWRDNETAAAIASEVVRLPMRDGPMPTARWHFDILRKVARAGIRHDALIDPSGFPIARGRHPCLAAIVHDLSALRTGYYRPGKRTWFRTLYGRGLRRARLLACVSDATRQDLLRGYPDLDPAKALVLPNAFEPALVDRSGRAPGTASEQPFLLAVGTREKRKNLVTTLDALAIARQDLGLDCALTLAGRDGNGAAAIRQRAARPDLLGAVRFVDDPTDSALTALYRQARALVFCSTEEGFGLPVLEAFANELPVLTSNRGALAEVAGDAALTVSPDDPRAIARGLVDIAQDESLRSRLSARGASRLRHFDRRRVASAWLSALEPLVG